MAATLMECRGIGCHSLVVRSGAARHSWTSSSKPALGIRYGKEQLFSSARMHSGSFQQIRINSSLLGERPTLCTARSNFEAPGVPFSERKSSSSSFRSNATKVEAEAPPVSRKGWDDPKQLAKLRSLAVIADDRSVMHADVAILRDNWGKLLQVTITMSMISAGLLAAINTRAVASFSLSFTSALLAAIAAMFMAVENYFQPAQSAEEQRAAARFFRNLVKELKASLKRGGDELKEEASSFYEAKLDKLKHLDDAFPLPLLPGVDKFPKEPKPSVLSPVVDTSQPVVNSASSDENSDNGWSSAIVEDLNRTSHLMQKSDVATYNSWQKNALKINRVLAIAGPTLAVISLVANFVAGRTGTIVAATCCVLAALCSSFSHDAQVGMVYEMYRQVAGAFVDMDNDIQRNLRMPVEQREDGEIFHQKIALQLGRLEGEAIVSSDSQEMAGTLL